MEDVKVVKDLGVVIGKDLKFHRQTACEENKYDARSQKKHFGKTQIVEKRN